MRKNFLIVVILAFGSLLVAQQTLNNDAVIKLIKAKLSDDLIVSTINATPGSYDTSVNGIIALKAAGASDKVVKAIEQKSSGGAAATEASGLPAGIDEVGVYFKDKTGAWTTLMPEMVDFKSNGALKNIASAGIVKGDRNGIIENQHAKTSLTFPVVLAVYVPEGTAITEYQLYRLRLNGNSREFLSGAGGVMHVSEGATRDYVDFQPDKIAPRVYQITLPADTGKGEYGLLPPGEVDSSKKGSGEKIYTVSITE
jgi:hypothetical protein